MTNTKPTLLNLLDTFGDVAAEQDAVLEYFINTAAVSEIESLNKFLILGRKGSGKTAIVRYFSENNTDIVSKALNLKGYPWSVHARRADLGVSDIEAYVSSWKYLIAVELAGLTINRDITTPYFDDVKSLIKFLRDNYGGTKVNLKDILSPTKLKLSKTSFEPTILGNKLGSINLERDAGDMRLGQELNALTESLLQAIHSVWARESFPKFILHFDELDQGLSFLDDSRKNLLIGLLLAARDVHQFFSNKKAKIGVTVYLRTDLWDAMQFSDKNKITQSQTLNLLWDNDSLQALVNARLQRRLGSDIKWNNIASPDLMRGSQTKWNHIISRTFLRPRDVISFLNSALVVTKKRNEHELIFSNEDITNARLGYSNYLKQELDDEISPHWAQWSEALQVCSRISTVTFGRDIFVEEYKKVRSKGNLVEADDALRLMYDFSVIGYASRSGYGGSSWTFQYIEPGAGWDNAATSFKVHVGLKEYAKLREERA